MSGRLLLASPAFFLFHLESIVCTAHIPVVGDSLLVYDMPHLPFLYYQVPLANQCTEPVTYKTSPWVMPILGCLCNIMA